jgi:hypothetical protein
MYDPETGLAECLARLLGATVEVDRRGAPETERREVEAAREEAAKILLRHRVGRGGPWMALPHLSSFFERWCNLRCEGMVEPCETADHGLTGPRGFPRLS